MVIREIEMEQAHKYRKITDTVYVQLCNYIKAVLDFGNTSALFAIFLGKEFGFK